MYLSDQIKNPIQQDHTPLPLHMKTCMEQHATHAMQQIGMYSGYLEKPTRDHIADLEITRQDLSDYLENHIQDCVEAYPNFEQRSIKPASPVTTIIFSDYTTIKISSAYSHGSETEIKTEQIDLTLPIRYRYIRDLAESITRETPVHDIMHDPGIEIEVAEQPSTLLWLITDTQKPYYFSFITER